jgi:DNA primase
MNIFNFIKSRVEIVQVINDYTSLKRLGVYWKGSCPFHHERTASFTVTPHKDIFYCFGCHKGGDVIAFIALAENCSQLEAARYLAERYGIELPEEVAWEKTEAHVEEKKRYHQLCELVATWCANNLSKSTTATTYIKNRGITQESVKSFSIGYFPPQKAAINSLLAFIQKENFIAQDLMAARIVLEGKHGLYSPFEERIIFPIKDAMGNFCGFGGRIFQPGDERAKYYNSHEHPFFNKGSLLFGFDRAKKQIQAKNGVFLVEGYTDCIAMVQAGLNNTVATLGTACSAEHLKTISRYAQQLYIVYDGDAAGQKAIIRLSEICWGFDMELFVLTLPPQEDPASFLQKSGDINALISGARDIFSCYIDQLEGESFTKKRIPERVHAVRELLAVIARVHDPLRRDLLLQRASDACAIPFQTLLREMSISKPKQRDSGEESAVRQMPIKEQKNLKSENFELEKQIFCAILNSQEISEEDATLLIATLPPTLGIIFNKLYVFRQSQGKEFSTFFSALEAKEQEIVSKALIKSANKPDPEEMARLLEQLRKKQWKIMVNDVKIRLAHAQQARNDANVQKIVAEFQSLKQKMLRKGRL